MRVRLTRLSQSKSESHWQWDEINLQKLWSVLEGLPQYDATRPPQQFYLETLTILRKKLNMKDENFHSSKVNILTFYDCYIDSSSPTTWVFVCYMYYILLNVLLQPFNANDTGEVEPLTPARKILVNYWLRMISVMHMGRYVERNLLKNPMLRLAVQLPVDVQIEKSNEIVYMHGSLTVFGQIIKRHDFMIIPEMEAFITQLIAALHTGIYQNNAKYHPNSLENIHSEYDSYLLRIFDLNKENYFKCLLIFKATKTMPRDLHEYLHNHMKQLLTEHQGFDSFCRNLIPSSITDEEVLKKRAAIVVSVVAHRGHDQRFYRKMAKEIYRVMSLSNTQKGKRPYLEVCLTALARIRTQRISKEVANEVASYVMGMLDVLHTTIGFTDGCVIFEHQQFLNELQVICLAFCGQLETNFESSLLINYLPLLFNLHNLMQDDKATQMMITVLVVKCLHNRDRLELKTIVDQLLQENYTQQMRTLSRQVLYTYSEAIGLTFMVNSFNIPIVYSPTLTLVQILKQSQNNLLIYQVFIHLLDELVVCLDDGEERIPELLGSDDANDVSAHIERAFKKRLSVIGTLTELINYKPFHSQFVENPRDIIECLMGILQKKLVMLRLAGPDEDQQNDPITLLVLSIIREYVEGFQTHDCFHDLLHLLKEYITICKTGSITKQIECILSLVGIADITTSPSSDFGEPEVSKFSAARSLCCESQPHLKVYGIHQFIKLIRDERDPETLANQHAILAIALEALRAEDSYIFLNCIKLLVLLVHGIESEVLECLVAEMDQSDEDKDYRFKVAEALVKLTEELGSLSYKYKDILIKCFLRGSTNKDPEYRTSSLANLGTVCRILCYQIHHFFEELMATIQDIIKNEDYKPARRAAILILAQIVEGFDKLQDFQDIVMPIYRLLNQVLETDWDPATKVHATNAMKHLQIKVKAFLTPAAVPPEIKIFGIKDPPADRNKNSGILELN